jgi:cytidine deaminase
MVRSSNDELISLAQAVLNPHVVDGRVFGDVALTLVTESGNRYSGVCIDTSSGTGLCAEHSAIAAMVTAGEYRIAKIVAVWRGDDGVLHVLSPCGRCREFIWQIDPANIDAEVVLDRDRSATLRELLPSTSGHVQSIDDGQAGASELGPARSPARCPCDVPDVPSPHARRTRLRSRSKLARPYVCRLSIFTVTWNLGRW